jgi:hypothetical protein
MIAMRVLLTINQQHSDVSEKNRVIIPSIRSFVIPSQNCHNLRGHLSFCKHKPAGFLRKFGLTVFSILIVWTHTACFLLILTDTSTISASSTSQMGSKPLDSRSLSLKISGHVEPRTLPKPVGKVTNFDSKSQGIFYGFCQKIWVHPTVFFPPGGWARWINSCGWTVQRLVSLTRKRPTGDLVSCGEGGEKKEWLPWENRMLEPFRKPHPAAIFSCFQYWKGKHAETVMISCGLSIPAIARAFLRTIGVSQGGMRPSQVCISSGYSWTPQWLSQAFLPGFPQPEASHCCSGCCSHCRAGYGHCCGCSWAQKILVKIAATPFRVMS